MILDNSRDVVTRCSSLNSGTFLPFLEVVAILCLSRDVVNSEVISEGAWPHDVVDLETGLRVQK